MSKPKISATHKAGPSRPKRPKNAIPLKDAVIQAIGKGPLGKDKILSAVKKLGYRLTGKSPLNSLNALLYGKSPKFKNEDGKSSLA